MAANSNNKLYGETGIQQPCSKDCPDRCAGCAVHCEKWRDYLQKRNARYEQQLQERNRTDITEANRRGMRERDRKQKRRAAFGK